ncbi:MULTISPECIES: SRPBCC family protein [Streptomyces]|uniref:hypothetical protein n=1 Tax=Streptomyces TaxID=1883 RepID=UPI001F2A9758|nr:hypothetical protein [Streptomyces ureilyticus]
MADEAGQLRPGALVYDPGTRKVGEYRDKAGPYAMLRPVGGGREWEADPALLRPATQEERIDATLRAANHRTKRRV